MLTEEDRQGIVSCIQKYCNTGMLPAKVDTGSWELRVRVSVWRKFLGYLSYATFLAHLAYVLMQLIVVLSNISATPLHHIILHMTMAGAGVMIAVWFYIIYVALPEDHARLVRMALCGYNDVGMGEAVSIRSYWHKFCIIYFKKISGESGCSQNCKERLEQLRQYSLQDLLAIFIPHMLVACVVLMLTVCMYDSTMKFLVYSILPESKKTWLWFVICSLEEVRFFMFWFVVSAPVFQIQLVSFENLKSALQTLICSMRTRE